MSKTRLNHLLLSITFNDKYWGSQLDFLHLSNQHNNKGHREKKSNLINTLLLLQAFDQKNYGFNIAEHFFLVHFTMLSPLEDFIYIHNKSLCYSFTFGWISEFLTSITKQCSCFLKGFPNHACTRTTFIRVLSNWVIFPLLLWIDL